MFYTNHLHMHCLQINIDNQKLNPHTQTTGNATVHIVHILGCNDNVCAIIWTSFKSKYYD